MKNKDVKNMLQHYLSVTQTGKEPYFDADQIEELLDYLDSIEDYTYYDEVLALGLKLHPGNSQLLLKKCALYVYEKSYDKALQLLDTLVDVDLDESYMIKLECYAAMGLYDKVVDFTRQLIDNQYENMPALFENTATVLNDEERYEEASDYIQWGLKLYPDSCPLKEELCLTLEKQGNLEQAITVCNSLIDERPYSYPDWMTLGNLYCTAQLYDKAIDAFDFALTCNDKNNDVYLLKGYCLYRNESYEKAVEVFNELLQQNGNSESVISEIMPMLSSCYLKLEEFEKGYELLKEQIYAKDTKPVAMVYIDYVRCCLELDRKTEAQKILQIATKIHPDNLRILTLYTLAMIEEADHIAIFTSIQKMIAILQSGCFVNPDDAESLMLIGKFLFLSGLCKEAVIFFKKVEELTPDQELLNTYLCLSYQQLHDFENFTKYLKKDATNEISDFMQTLTPDEAKEIIVNATNPIDAKTLTNMFLNNKDNYN